MKFVEPIGPNRKFGSMGHPSRGTETMQDPWLHPRKGHGRLLEYPIEAPPLTGAQRSAVPFGTIEKEF
jgi:hypothetical protein